MPITVAFTVSAGVALVGLLLVFREFWLRRRAMMIRKQNGLGREVATMLVIIGVAFVLSDALQFIAGLGLLVQQRWLAYLLALPPLVKLAAALLILRSIARQRVLSRKRS